MPDQLYKYKVFCETEQAWIFTDYRENPPTVCPNDNEHTIDSDSIIIVDVVDLTKSEVVVQEETTKTGGHFQTTGIEMDIPATVGWTEVSHSWPIPIGLLSASYNVDASHNPSDKIEAVAAKDQIYGALTSDASSSDTVLDVAQTVIDNMVVGHFVKLDDGTNSEEVGRILSIDEENLQITIETALTQGFLAATPTYVKGTAKFIQEMPVGFPGRYTIGDSKIGASHVPANTPLTFRYYNSEAVAKKFVFIMEYLY